jgi:hypothetical protein
MVGVSEMSLLRAGCLVRARRAMGGPAPLDDHRDHPPWCTAISHREFALREETGWCGASSNDAALLLAYCCGAPAAR